MTPKKPESLADAIKQDVLAGNLPELNPGDRARYEAEEAEAGAQRERELQSMVDEAVRRADSALDRQQRGEL